MAAKLIGLIFIFCGVFEVVKGLECYQCFYTADGGIARELKSIFGNNSNSCEAAPSNCFLQTHAMHHLSADDSSPPVSYLETGQVSRAILDSADKGHTLAQVEYDHCALVTGTINGQKFVFRTGRYFGLDMDGQCVDTETVVKGMRVIEKDCYCARNRCNGAGHRQEDEDCNGQNLIQDSYLLLVLTLLSNLYLNV